MVLIEYVFQILHWYMKMPAKSLAALCGADCFHLWALQMFRSVDVSFLWSREVKTGPSTCDSHLCSSEVPAALNDEMLASEFLPSRFTHLLSAS